MSGLRDPICIPYLDDILCYGKNFDENFENLKTVYRRLRKFEVKLKAKKFILFKPEIRYIGKVVREKVYKYNPGNREAIGETVGDLENSWDFWVVIDNLSKISLEKLNQYMTFYLYHLKMFAKTIINQNRNDKRTSSSELLSWSKDYANIIS